MDNENKELMKENTEIVPVETDEMLPAEIDLLPLKQETAEVVNKIIKANSLEELKSYTDKFNLNMAKKNAVRVAKLQNLLDAVNDQAIDRFTEHPDEFSNKEVLDYMRVVNEQVTSATKGISDIEQNPMIQVNNQKNEVTVNVEAGQLSRESKTRVMDAVKSLLQKLQVAPESVSPEEELYNSNEDVEPDYDAVYDDDETNRDLNDTSELDDEEDED